MILYKYRSDSPFTRDLVEKKQVWLSTARALNDPFECTIQDLAPEWVREKTTIMKKAQMAGFVDQAAWALDRREPFFGATRNEVKRALQRIRRLSGSFRHRYAEFRRIYESATGAPPSDPDAVFEQLESQLQSIGIFSMSEVADNSLMWSHYGDEHRGLAIGFEAAPGSKLADETRCLRVQYRDEVPAYQDGYRPQLVMGLGEDGRLRAMQRMSFDDEIFRAAITTKATAWSHERERRYIEESAGAYPWPGPIAEVVFGMRCAPDVRQRYRDLIERAVPNDVKFFEMVKLHNTNAMERVPIRG